MPLSPGTRLGAYEIVAPLGKGGMGEVYKAKDTRLPRTVAIKVQRRDASSGGDDFRFRREAEVIAGLSHPHICTLHDIGQEDGRDYLVMEYVEGETLAHRLEAHGRLALPDALRHAAEIADALAVAHAAGVVHQSDWAAHRAGTRKAEAV